ncbi:G-type lectin S-receptor-like serine/threonine-protein kinase [Vitis vinifera]|uniref:G-type lectin S-receptor-like serine/threonine-protein kinase n=1 Tax=Vitis vinifera TaxID=29760 RepID=A0A438DP87_VITVI|nr:G-type lectin S-receptor-like serine/threonine-protein kinase [Vitis vinifera]
MDSLTTVAGIFSYVLSLLRISVAVDTIIVNQNITNGETITSAGGNFELGFFSPGVLKVTQPRILVLVNGTNGILWNSTSSRSAQDPNAQLLESGNLVMRNGNDRDPENFLWQSFDYPCDTLLPGMKLGRNRVAGLDRYLSSWKSADDPSKGNFTYWIDPSGFPQLLLRNGLTVAFRPRPWNGCLWLIALLLILTSLKASLEFIHDHKSYPDKRCRRIRTCLSGEVESSSSPIRRKVPDVKYPEKVERRPDRIAAVRHPEKVGCRPGVIPTLVE